MLKTGKMIANRYEILVKIGTGGMADVYKAKDHKLNRFVAVKILKPEFRKDTTFIRKFRSEAQAAAGLTHPNIVNVFDVGNDEGIYYIVMELIEGITLKEYISKKGKLSVKEATSIAIQVSMGLEAAHSHSIVHRDVKPQNIIISTDGKVKVTDFGIARAASSNTISSNVMGSVHYSSPEQLRGGYSDEKSDIYSLGITLYEMVTGKVPYDGDSTVTIAIKHLQEEMVPPSVYAEDLPYSLEQIIYKCTQKSIDRRYASMEQVIEDLKHSLIDPQGDFVDLSPVDNAARTVIITDDEIGKIKSTSKVGVHQKENSEYEDSDFYDDVTPVVKYNTKKTSKNISRNRKRKSDFRIYKLVFLTLGAIGLIVIISLVLKYSGILEPIKNQDRQSQDTTEKGMVEAPDLVGKTEAEAKEITSSLHIGIQNMGEKTSTQEKGRIASQDITPGTKIAEYSTIKYYVSKGMENITLPEITGKKGVEIVKVLKEDGLNVNLVREYSEADEDGNAKYDIGYVISMQPAAGQIVKAGDTVTVVVSRGLNFGAEYTVPGVVGLTEDDAITTLSKFQEIKVDYQKNNSVPKGQVISQNPAEGEIVSPDQIATIVVSSGNEEAKDEKVATAVDNSNSGWKCTQTLNTPTGYQGGPLKMELIQDVNGQPQSTTVVNGKALSFPYKLDINGAKDVSTGTLYLYEEINGDYQELGNYNIEFKKVK